jgi:hypothetical protein
MLYGQDMPDHVSLCLALFLFSSCQTIATSNSRESTQKKHACSLHESRYDALVMKESLYGFLSFRCSFHEKETFNRKRSINRFSWR